MPADVVEVGNSLCDGLAMDLNTTSGSPQVNLMTAKPLTFGIRMVAMVWTAGSFSGRFCHNFSLLVFDAPVREWQG